MPAGMKYNLDPIATAKEMCRFETVYRLSGGFNLDLSNLENGAQVPPFTPLAVDFKTRKATAVKNVRVVSAVTSVAKTINIAKGSLAYVGMFVGNGTNGAKVTGIDKSNADYDVVTTDAAFGAEVAKGSVLFEARLKARDDKVDAIYVELRKVESEKQQLIAEKHRLELELEILKLKRCDKRACEDRIPPSDY